MNVLPLQSGSNGNCICVEAGGVTLLFDAGISGRQAKERLAIHGRDIRKVDALVISHDHIDHVSCAGIYQRKFGMPLFITQKTLRAAQSARGLGGLGDVHHFRSGDALRFGAVRVETMPTPHDGADGVAFIIDDGISRLGIFTDLGHVYGDLKCALASVDAALVESNYDPAMLEAGRYPYPVKRRISGPGGHLSNIEAAELVAESSGHLRWVCLAHLSEENNTPELALRTHRTITGALLRYHVASRYTSSRAMKI